nr:hypothetical protein [Tanacetum cinerariifolium]
MYMLTEKGYPLSSGVMTLMLSTKLPVEEDSEIARDLVMKIFMKANQPKSKKGEGSGAPTELQHTPFPTHHSTGDEPPVTESSSSHDTTQNSLDLEGTNGSKEDQGRKKDKKDKPKPTLNDSTFDADLYADHGMDYMDTEEPMNEGRLSEEIEELVSTARPEDSTVRPDMKEEKSKEKRVSIKDIEDSSRPARSILTLKPLLTIGLKDKGKCVLEEPEPIKKMTKSDLDAAQITKDAEEKEASKAAIAKMYNEVQAGIEVDELFTAKLQQEEREEYTIKERAKFLAETIAAQRKFRAAQRFAEIRKIQGLYERQKRVIDDFKPIDLDDAVDKEKVLEEPDSTKIEVKQEGDEESIRKRPGRRHKIKATKKFDRIDIKELYNLVMHRFDTTSPEEEWILKSWNFYENCGVHTLTFKDGTEIYMLAERRYPLTKETLERMLALRLIAESEIKAVFDLLRLTQKQIDESGSYDGSEKDLKGLKFSGKITPLFLNMLIQAEGEGSGAPTELQHTPFPTHHSTRDEPPVSESSSSHNTTQDSLDLKGTNRSKGDQGRKKDKKDKPKPTLNDSTFDADLYADHGMDYMDTEEPMNEGRLSEEIEELVSTARPEDSTVRPDVGIADPIAPPITTTSICDDEDITMAQTLIKIKEEKSKEKRVSIKDIEDSLRPARSILTLKPLLTIGLKDKGKGVLEEPEPIKKMTKSDLDAAQITKDAEREKEASKAAIAKMYDKVQAGIEADELFTAKLQQEEREEYTIKERAKFLAETIAAQRKFRAAQRFAEIRSLYERQKRVIDDFKPMDLDDAVDKEKVLEEPDSTKIEIVPDEEGEVDYEVLDKRFPIINWESKFYHLNRHGTEFDRMDIKELYNLVMQRFDTTSPEERRYPLTKETLKRMLALRLIVESESKAVFDLLRHTQKQIDESGSYDRSEKDLKELASLKQTTLGKDISNPLIVHSLLKTIWLSVHHVIAMKHGLF